MERFKAGVQSVGRQSSSEGGSFNTSGFASDQAAVLVRRDPGERMISLRTSFKIWTIGVAAGIVVGFTFERRFRRWVTKMLKRLKDD